MPLLMDLVLFGVNIGVNAAFGLAVGFGIAAGFSPGPLTTLVLSESLVHGRLAGVKVALAPLITDPPIIFISLGVLYWLSRLHGQYALGVVSLLGAAILCLVAWKSFHAKESHFEGIDKVPRSLSKALAVNIFNPNAYLFWLCIIGPLVIDAYHKSFWLAAVFILIFYVLLVGIKMSLALIAGTASRLMTSKWLVRVNWLLGGALLIYAILFALRGVSLLRGQPLEIGIH
jgi:threonine/homoserine/homoserine lactone efflux protein